MISPDLVARMSMEPGEYPEPDEPVTAAAARTDENLREYWVHGEGALKIRWGAPGAFKRCVNQLNDYSEGGTAFDPEGLCAEMYHQATGRWPGQKKDHTSLDTDVMELMNVELAEPCLPCMLEPRPGEMWHAVAHTEGVSTGQRVWLPGALSWREPPFAFHHEIESSAHGGTARIVQVGMVTRVEKIGDQVHAWGNIDTLDKWGSEAARKLAQGFLKGVSMGPGSEKIGYDQVWPVGITAEQMARSEPEQWVFTSYRIGELTAVSVEAQEGAFLEPTPELLALMGVGSPRMEQETFMVASAGAVHRPGLNCCRSPLHPGPCKGWKGNRQTPSLAPEKRDRPFKNTPAQNKAVGPSAREKLRNAEKMFGSDRSKWSPAQRKAADKLEAADVKSREPGKAQSDGGRGSKLASMSAADLGSELKRIRESGDLAGTSREDVREGLGKRTVPQLRQIADTMGISFLRKNKADMVSDLVEGSVGFHMNSQAIRGGSWKDRFSGDASIMTAGAGSWTITVADLPSEEMFVKDFPEGTPPTLTDDGRFFGYFAPGNTAHRGAARGGVRKTAKQLGKTDYSRWLRRLPTAEGTTVLAGPITMECMHAPTQGYGTLDRRHQFYEDSCSIVARASVGEDNDGARWFSGTIMPGITSQQVEKLLMCQLSLDCQPHPDRRGWQDFVGVLAVPLPAWPVPVTASAADGEDGEDGLEPGVAVSRIVEDEDFVFITASSSPPIQYVPAPVYLTEAAMYAIAGVDPAQIVRDNAVSFEAALRGDMT